MTFSLLPPVRDVPISATTNGNVSPPWLKKIEDATDIRRNILIAFERGELEAALIHYQKALSLKPDLADAYNNMGNVLKELGKLQAAHTKCSGCHTAPRAFT